MRLPRLLAALPLALAALLPLNSAADWQVNSGFLLNLPESSFDSLIQDFWSSLQGKQNINVGNIPVNMGNTQLAINGVTVALNYSFPVPTRITSSTAREWQLQSNAISATVTIPQLVITQQSTIFVGGIPVGTTVTVVCNNISLTLPAGQASVQAVVEAQVVNNQVQLSMPSYNASWPTNAWQVNAINCPDLANVGQTVQTQILGYLSSFSNLDSYVSGALVSEFNKWSQQASVLLLSQQNIPTGVSYLTATYAPSTAQDTNGNGLILGGTIVFDYPNVSPGQHFEQDFALPAGTSIVPQANPQLLMPFQAMKAMMVGQYFAGQLSYTVPSSSISGFQSLQNNFFAKLFGWPNLLDFATNAVFLFQAVPVGPPSFDSEAAGGTNVITGNLTQPLELKMSAPKNGTYIPYVDFNTTLTGPATLTLGAAGQVNLQMTAANEPVTYAYAQSYIDQYHPDTYIAAGTIGSSAFAALNTSGVQLTIPPLSVGASLKLQPADWALLTGDVLQLQFSTTGAAAAPAAAAVAPADDSGDDPADEPAVVASQTSYSPRGR